MNTYSDLLKERMASKILMFGGPSARSLSRETGISQTALSRWVLDYKGRGVLMQSSSSRLPKDRSRQERLEVLLETSRLKDNTLGEYLRKHGLTLAHLEKWKDEFIRGDVNKQVGRPGKSASEKALLKENKGLRRDLHRKDKALAETAALLILKKKAQEIWGDVEGEE